MNILLNNYCNLKCEYCFANEVIAEEKQAISLEDFQWLIEFLWRSGLDSIRLIGGEPTLHPQFADLLIEVGRHQFIKEILLFTNGTYNDRIGFLLQLIAKAKRMNVLLNYNDPEVIGEEKNTIILHNIKNLSQAEIRTTLGINFYKPDQDYAYLIEAALKYKMKIRWSIVVPNTEEKKNYDVRKYFSAFVPLISQFIQDCAHLKIQPGVDCNNIPLCLLDDETLRLIALLAENNLKTSICSPVVDVKPSLKAIRCFILNRYEVDIKNFETLEELKGHFHEKVDQEFLGRQLFPECEKCASFQINNKSCACLGFKREVG